MPLRANPGASAHRWLKLRVWAGVVPLAGFLIVHLLLQASALAGSSAHARWGSPELAAPRLALSVAFIYLPLTIHAGLGLWRPLRAGPVADASDWQQPLGLALQRLSAAVLLIFLVWHVWQFPLRAWSGELVPTDYYPELCASLSSTRWGGVPLVAIGYLTGIATAALHGAQGLYHGGLGLGLVGPARAALWARCCRGLGFALFGVGALIVIDLATGSVLIHLSGS